MQRVGNIAAQPATFDRPTKRTLVCPSVR